MGVGLTPADASPERAIIVEPLSAGVGLHIGGVDLHALSDGTTDLILDLWQVGSALLFRQQADPAGASRKLAAIFAGAPAVPAPQAEPAIGQSWSMIGAVSKVPPSAIVLHAEPALPALELAGMEAAADALRMESPALFAKLASAYCAHTDGGPPHPLLHRHALTGEACLYPPPLASGNLAAGEFQQHADALRFRHTHVWEAGDVLAVDPRAVRCRWAQQPASAPRMIVLPGSMPLAPVPAPLGTAELWNLQQ